ncbi:YlbL family protein [Paenibacillus wulumuqiensis]|uniref:YlbL family protein n=1 Tax=Paenibacillus wulumuqiensis TaxID=1567107 RepID=UPI0006192AAF|nr:PDZ domain-containing protein [Paenibacillus wulumuqiensis]
MSGRNLRPPLSSRRSWLYLLCMIILVYVLVYMPTPYVLNAPGSADELKPMVTVSGGDPTEKGTFMMTTVSVSYANMAMLIGSVFDDNEEIGPKPPQSNHKEYEAEQLYYMNSSQSNAVAAAYHRAGVPYSVEPQYVFVINVPEGNTQIHAGDRFVKLDGQAIDSFAQLEKILQSKKAGDTVDVTFDRAGTTVEQQITLKSFRDASGKSRVGFGVSIGEVQKVTPDDPAHEVHFASTSIGGPSAGLMFTLEIYNQLTDGDLSKGYRIAGTGTIDVQGNVGVIGGVQHKVVAAQEKGAEIFFVPQGNYPDAQKQLQKMHSTMRLIPVKTLDDALRELDRLPAKG